MRVARLAFVASFASALGCGEVSSPTIDGDVDPPIDAIDAPGDAILAVTKTGTGTGVVASVPAGIDCGATCSASFNLGQVVTLTAAAASGSAFAGWSGGGCSGTGTCMITVSAATNVTATFNSTVTIITIAKSGPAAAGALVTSSPAGITCGATCSGTFTPGTVVTLSQTPDGSVFSGWTGIPGCTGTGNCTFTVADSTTITAGYRALRVAIETPVGSCIRNAGNTLPRVQSLLAGRGHTITIVAGPDIDTAAEIGAYDVVAIASRYGCGGSVTQDLTNFDPIIDAYVRTAGGGVVAQGWQLYGTSDGTPGIDGILPATRVANYLDGNQNIAVVAGHPITAGVGAFTAGQYVPWGGGPKTGATSLLMSGATVVAESWSVGAGRSVFAGPMFLEEYGAYENESLTDGTQPAAIEFLMRAIEWAGKAR